MNRRIAEYAMSLTDALFAVEVKDGAARPERSFGSAAHLRVGHQSRPGWTTPSRRTRPRNRERYLSRLRTFWAGSQRWRISTNPEQPPGIYA